MSIECAVRRTDTKEKKILRLISPGVMIVFLNEHNQNEILAVGCPEDDSGGEIFVLEEPAHPYDGDTDDFKQRNFHALVQEENRTFVGPGETYERPGFGYAGYMGQLLVAYVRPELN